jgi:hypothetical protein
MRAWVSKVPGWAVILGNRKLERLCRSKVASSCLYSPGNHKKAGGDELSGFCMTLQLLLLADENIDVRFVYHSHQACIFGLNDLVMMIG